MSRYVPSKVCPHRCCRYLHSTVAWGSTVVALTQFQLWLQIAIVIALLGRAHAEYMRRKYKLPPYLLRIERPNQYLIVRRWWARAAIAGDVLLAGFVLVCVASNIALRAAGKTPAMPGGAADLIIGALIGTVLMLAALGAVVFCHWMATRPAKPKRVRVPANASFGAA